MGLATIDSYSLKVHTKFYKIPKSGLPYISLLILAFLNCCISVKTSLINTKLGDVVNLRVLFLVMWINSCLSYDLQTPTLSFSVWFSPPDGTHVQHRHPSPLSISLRCPNSLDLSRPISVSNTISVAESLDVEKTTQFTGPCYSSFENGFVNVARRW